MRTARDWDPLTRLLDQVKKDWVAGIISTEHARDVDGVVFSDGEIDSKATRRERKSRQ